MCYEDYQMSKFCRSVWLPIAWTTSVAEIVPEDATRIGVIMGVPSSVSVGFGPSQSSGSTDAIIQFANGVNVFLNYREHGDLVRRKLFGRSFSGTPISGAILISFDERAFLEARSRGYK